MTQTRIVPPEAGSEWPPVGFLAASLIAGTVLPEEGPIEPLLLAGGVPGQPEPGPATPGTPGDPPLPNEPGEPTVPDRPPPSPVA